MATPSELEILEKDIRQRLDGTPYKSKSLQRLTGGSANFTYIVYLETPLLDGTEEVVIKHGENFVASNPKFPLATSRCVCHLLGHI